MKLSDDQIARVCHEANRAYCMGIGDHSIPTWDMAPPWQKESAVLGVGSARKDPSLTPAKSHEAWLAHKQATGWKYGPTKRPEALEHPCMVPYAQLPVEHQLKDALFLAVVGALTAEMPVSDAEVATAVLDHESAHSDDTLETGILTEDGLVVKDGEISQDVVESTKPGKKKRG